MVTIPARHLLLPVSPASSVFAALLVVTWLISAGWLLWYFETQRLAGDQRLFHFDARALPPPPAGSARGATVLYFLPQGCRCDGAARAEIERLQHVAGTHITQFAVSEKPLVPGGVDMLPFSVQERARWLAVAPHTPAAALWDEKGTLVYFGPLGRAAGCGAGGGYLLSAWQRLVANRSAAFTAWDVVSCACAANSA